MLTEDAVTQILKNGDYQVDQYTYQVGGIRDDRNENIKGKLGKYGLGNYLDIEPDYSEVPVGVDVISNKILREQYYDKMVAKGIYIDKSHTWHEIQNIIDNFNYLLCTLLRFLIKLRLHKFLMLFIHRFINFIKPLLKELNVIICHHLHTRLNN